MNKISEQNLADSLARLPRERKPRNDLWQDIEARLQVQDVASHKTRNATLQKRFGIAAMLAIAVISAYQFGLQRGVAVNQTGLAAASAAYRLEMLSHEYIGAIREAAALTAQQSETRMPDETVAGVQTSMKNIIETEAMLRTAIKAEPGNEFLGTLLVRLQSRKLQLIQEIPKIEQQIWRTL